jgi:hypothetical protein
MKYLTLGLFTTRSDAEKAINEIHSDLDISHDNISFLYKNTNNETKEVNTSEVTSTTPREGATTGAAVGGTLGALAGIAAVVGFIPVVGPIFAAGPLLAAIGIGGAVGTAAAGAIAGAAAGGLIGALANLGVSEERAKVYADRVSLGNVLVAVYTNEDVNVGSVMTRCGAEEVEVFRPSL